MMDAFYHPSYGYGIDPDSDDDAIRIDGQESSEEEEEFAGDIAIRKFLLEYERSSKAESRKSEDDSDLEKELDAELDSRVAELEKRRFVKDEQTYGGSRSNATPLNDPPRLEMDVDTEQATPPDGSTRQDGGSGAKNPEQLYYDDDYYDSDDDENEGDSENTKKANKAKHPVISNDDLFYDPNIDDDNQKWMDERRAKQRSEAKGKAPNSDALLDCPACLTTVCIDCQRHEIYDNQFRAMFVQNCVVDPTEVITAPSNECRKRKRGRTPDPPDERSKFPAVRCSECQTIVGAIDTEEIYYFFNVVASHT